MSTTFVVDGNFYLWRALSVVIKRKNTAHLTKNAMTMFLNMVSADAVHHHATHFLACFDARRSFRNDIYKDYKANRVKSGTTTVTLDNGQEFTTDITPGSLVKPAREMLGLAGLYSSQKKMREADDLLGSAALSLPGRIVIGTRDKDIASTVNTRVSLWWPIEKKLIGPAEVLKHFGVKPSQIADYLSLMGDKVDNIPGILGCGPKTACAILAKYGTLDNAVKDKAFREKYDKHKRTLAMARKLVALLPDVTYDLEDLVPQKIDKALGDVVWAIPDRLKDLGEFRKMNKMKGLFGD